MKLIGWSKYWFGMMALSYGSYFGHKFGIPILGNLPILVMTPVSLVGGHFLLRQENYKVTTSESIKAQHPKLYTLMEENTPPGKSGKRQGPNWRRIRLIAEAGAGLDEAELAIIYEMDKLPRRYFALWTGIAIVGVHVFIMCAIAGIDPMAVTY